MSSGAGPPATPPSAHGSGPPAALLRRHDARILRAARLGPVADLACGSGRNAIGAAKLGASVIGIDRDADALRRLAEGPGRSLGVLPIRADLEAGHEIPLRPGSCGAVLVFRFLFRPLASGIEDLLAPGGVLLYETFTIRQRDLGYGPGNPAFLLHPQELKRLFPGLSVLDYEEGRVHDGGRDWETARLLAQKPAG